MASRPGARKDCGRSAGRSPRLRADGGSRDGRGHARSAGRLSAGRGGGATRAGGLILFADRRDAGRTLAQLLLGLAAQRPLIAALPRGGVPVGFEVARALDAPLDVLVVRKLGAPGNPELGVGAIAEGGGVVIDDAAAGRAGMSQDALAEVVARERAELQRRVERYRGRRPPLDVAGRTVLVVDDGLATGLTAIAAVRALRAGAAERVVVAVPVGARDSVARVGGEADAVVCATTPRRLLAVGYWYADFSAVSDEEVLALLGRGDGVDSPAA